MCVIDRRARFRNPCFASPSTPSVLFLIEDVEWLVAKLRELCTPTGTALDGAVLQNMPDNKDLLAIVDLVPDALKDPSKRRGVWKRAAHQPADVREADITLLQFQVRQDPDAASPGVLVSVECEVHFLNAVTLRRFTKRRFRARRCSTEQNAIFRFHLRIMARKSVATYPISAYKADTPGSRVAGPGPKFRWKVPTMPITEIAKQFFEACEAGKGWDVCKAYCRPDATFSAQAEPLAGVRTLQEYTDWMKGLLKCMPD